ncbi:LamG domain-containing protein [Marinigracilibium pacificum]|uniref:LamG domain-containing protein n=1 Tax=Marinigracilibium pacificum TaxID=2729599 RepID=A0A848IXQ3_9BACT|nr:LamG domain-containing protein [Marinigracilibium pacificum]NMM49077.1 LamG domain-containing protein [Marinigracilibium pacificum]
MRIFKISTGVMALLSLCLIVINLSCAKEEVTPDNGEVIDIPRDGLVAFYPFNGNYNDESGVGEAANLVKKGTNGGFTTDRYGNENSAFLSDFDQWLEVQNDKFIFDSDFTLTAWAKAERSEDKKGQERLFQSSSYYFGYATNIINKLSCYVKKSGAGYRSVLSDEIQNISEWKFVCFTYKKGERETSIYIDGKLHGKEIQEEGFEMTIPSNTFYLFGSYFDGIGDDAAIYNKALNQNEIDQLYRQNITK